MIREEWMTGFPSSYPEYTIYPQKPVRTVVCEVWTPRRGEGVCFGPVAVNSKFRERRYLSGSRPGIWRLVIGNDAVPGMGVVVEAGAVTRSRDGAGMLARVFLVMLAMVPGRRMPAIMVMVVMAGGARFRTVFVVLGGKPVASITEQPPAQAEGVGQQSGQQDHHEKA